MIDNNAGFSQMTLLFRSCPQLRHVEFTRWFCTRAIHDDDVECYQSLTSLTLEAVPCLLSSTLLAAKLQFRQWSRPFVFMPLHFILP
jgi:hypothetical protein